MAFFVALVVPLAFSSAAAKSPWTVTSYPNPAKGTCGGDASTDRVCDPDGIVTSLARLEIQRAIYSLERGTPHNCGDSREVGFQVAVALARSIEGGKDAAGSFARGLHNAWGVGHAACNDGVVLLLSVDDRRAHVSTGSGASKVVTDAHVAAIIERMRPALRRGDYKGAVLGAVGDIRAVLEAGEGGATDVSASISKKSASSWTGWAALCVFLIVLFFVPLWHTWNESNRRRDWEAVRRRLLDLERLATGGAAAAAAAPAPAGAVPPSPLASRMLCCPICLDDFPSIVEATSVGGTPVVVSLPCRHRFHVSCLDGWFGTHKSTTCPVCRAVTVGTAAGEASAAQPRGLQENVNNEDRTTRRRHIYRAPEERAVFHSGAVGDDNADTLFILGRLRERYPQMVTDGMISRCREALTNGALPRPAADPDFIAADPFASKATNTGDGGGGDADGGSWDSGDFGGGDCDGGGGDGGDW